MSFSALKTLALLSMLCDHVTRIFSPSAAMLPLVEWVERCHPAAAPAVYLLWEWVPRLMGYFGRLAAPIFLFCLVNGFLHTRSVKRYGARLLAFALLSQVPYLLFFRAEARMSGYKLAAGETGWNILFTLFLGLVMLWAVERLKQRHWALGAGAALTFLALARLLNVEGREGYLFIILTLRLLWDRPPLQRVAAYPLAAVLGRRRLIAAAVGEAGLRPSALLNTLGPCLGLWLTLCYNGRKGWTPRWFQLGFYAFYPFHLLVLAAVGFLLPVG